MLEWSPITGRSVFESQSGVPPSSSSFDVSASAGRLTHPPPFLSIPPSVSNPRGGTTASVPSSGGGQASQKRAGSVVRTVKEHELPWRLQRKDIDEAEMAYINRGGPE
uniref:Ribosomal protein S36 n=1 Tax=Timema bartmani TaxID=61472 RepID=A0A7R9EVU0_9NEOP|nr:unnamed protein product [Timema bartmani]